MSARLWHLILLRMALILLLHLPCLTMGTLMAIRAILRLIGSDPRVCLMGKHINRGDNGKNILQKFIWENRCPILLISIIHTISKWVTNTKVSRVKNSPKPAQSPNPNRPYHRPTPHTTPNPKCPLLPTALPQCPTATNLECPLPYPPYPPC